MEHIEIAAAHFDIIDVGEGIDIQIVKEAIGDKVCLSGNADP